MISFTPTNPQRTASRGTSVHSKTKTGLCSPARSTQLSIDFEAREAGSSAANACEKKARSIDPDFSEKAATAILAHLRTVGQASGEVLTDVAIAHGARAHDQRAFGAVFSRLSRKGLIRTMGYCMRSKGHGTSGGRIWGLAL